MAKGISWSAREIEMLGADMDALRHPLMTGWPHSSVKQMAAQTKDGK